MRWIKISACQHIPHFLSSTLIVTKRATSTIKWSSKNRILPSLTSCKKETFRWWVKNPSEKKSPLKCFLNFLLEKRLNLLTKTNKTIIMSHSSKHPKWKGRRWNKRAFVASVLSCSKHLSKWKIGLRCAGANNRYILTKFYSFLEASFSTRIIIKFCNYILKTLNLINYYQTKS